MIHAVHVSIIIKRLSGYGRMLPFDYVAAQNAQSMLSAETSFLIQQWEMSDASFY